MSFRSKYAWEKLHRFKIVLLNPSLRDGPLEMRRRDQIRKINIRVRENLMKKNHALRVALKKSILLHWPKIINSCKRNDNEKKKHAAGKFSTPPIEMHYPDKASG